MLTAKEAREIGLISKAINDPKVNPHLRREWDPAQIEERAKEFPPEVLDLWLYSIMHLQRYAWRLHSKSCFNLACPGCPGYEVRRYFHQKQAEFIAWDGYEAWVITGNRWGKTDALVFAIVCRILGYNPLTNELYPLPQNAWLVGLSFPMVRDILIPKFKKQMPDLSVKWSGDVNPWDFSKTDLIAKVFNGSECGFKCMRWDQEVLMADGHYKRIIDIIVGDRVCVRHHFGKYGIQDKTGIVRKKYNGGKVDLIRIILQGRREIICSREHKIFDGLSWREAGSFKKGMRLPYRGVPEPEKTNSIGFNPWLLGFIIGDGCLRGKQIRVTVCDPDVYKKVLKEVNKIGANLSRSHNDDYAISLPRDHFGFTEDRDPGGHGIEAKTSPLIDWLKQAGLWGKKSRQKFVPDCLFNATNHDISEFLSGLFTADGTLTPKPSISLSTGSKQLAFEVQKLLDRLAVKSGVYYIRKTDSWRVTTMGKYAMINFFKWIPWVKYPEKAERLKASLPETCGKQKLGIVSVSETGRDAVCDIEVENARCYTVAGITVHNSCDAGITKFRGAGKQIIGFDEEPDREVYSECSIRVEGGSELIFRGAMTPDPFKGLTWTYHELLKNKDRQEDINDLRIWTGSIHENPSISQKVKVQMAGKMDAWEQEVRFEGQYISGLGRCVFDVNILADLRSQAEEPVMIRPKIGGNLKLWEDSDKRAGYVIGVDAAEGLEHGDNSVISILKRGVRPKLIGCYAGKMDPDQLGKLALGLADEFNEAWMVIEMNNHGFTVMNVFRTVAYANLYTEKSFDKWGAKESRKWGWYTNTLTKPILVDEIARSVREKAMDIPDMDTLSEMGTFIINPKGKAEAQSGCADDRVIALGLCLQGHIRCPSYEPPVKKDSSEKPPLNELAWMVQ